MTTDLTRARRKLASLRIRRGLLTAAWFMPECNGRFRREARRMSREYAAQITAQELECRRLALVGPWEAVVVDIKWTARRRLPASTDLARRYTGRNAKTRAVSWAERQNAKEGRADV